MEEYTFLRQFADSWMLVLLFLFFIGVVIWVFRPSSRKTYQDTANIPFRHEDKPAPQVGDITGKSKEARS
ncbi:CcoQ/FixQ family Cbb3-type cytochrome c oxidase assembly chaperone [Sedimentitalea nanhaiensis]|uniref:Cytochrome c oxidase cbb3-type subunit 4 n=1 Tax=Sedimentitalea nanhaiensis TaxID=999627 RepID=A0A1I6XFG2_9RHOB|nr:CcoQ/FixQ family Cbb3-type cytochrome c oxidase assembly chaperone [Sedimentitalea nanhaiensis]SFT36772.1 cytochrome c oxidase cbb3-type subunit 4 [Sedimentitalea nanhaiensis]